MSYFPIFASLFIAAVSLAKTIPHNQFKEPGPALSPEKALTTFKVPEGFSVELVASEPEIINPVGMAFDERGRIWIIESLDYPRIKPGNGGDRIKILEDTDGDGRMDSVKIFAEGLSVPSGIAIGYGGVWVTSSPDILFLRDTDGDDKADKREVVVTGFGIRDMHELPNSLTWGPDGYLYGLNGVFNPSVVESGGKKHAFTCAMFRIHPRTRKFEVFSEGTSNPWGIAWNNRGDAFVSACVVDHLWHLTETGYYHRQAGVYPPRTWKIESIVDHKHQKRAYCGITWFDSAAYPEKYREKLYMGNIHGNAVNMDQITETGATYKAQGLPDFLSSSDPWFMPVSQKTGPDGSLYVLDWYDKYHCYQDAKRDPAGIDRQYGRLYRVRYKSSPRAAPFDLGKETDAALLKRLSSPNIYFRETAQRILSERNTSRKTLLKYALGDNLPKFRAHALWALISGGAPDAPEVFKILESQDPVMRAWGVRAIGNAGHAGSEVIERIQSLASDRSPRVRLQVAITTAKLKKIDTMKVLLEVLENSGNDLLTQKIIWRNLSPLLENNGRRFIEGMLKMKKNRMPHGDISEFLTRAIDSLLSDNKYKLEEVLPLTKLAIEGGGPASLERVLAVLRKKLEKGEFSKSAIRTLKTSLGPLLPSSTSTVNIDVALLKASWGNPASVRQVKGIVSSSKAKLKNRITGIEVLASIEYSDLPKYLRKILKSDSPTPLKRTAISILGRSADPDAATILLKNYSIWDSQLKSLAIDALTTRHESRIRLLKSVFEKKIPAQDFTPTQVRSFRAAADKSMIQKIDAIWRISPMKNSRERESEIRDLKYFIRSGKGNPRRGGKIFDTVCGLCHKIYGKGADVGPDLTGNGRGSFDQLINNVFVPNLVIGDGYNVSIAKTKDGQVVSGIIKENDERVLVLKISGGLLRTIPKKDLESLEVQKISMMPEGLEKTMSPKDLLDLFSFLILDHPPGDKEARFIPGYKPLRARIARKSGRFAEVIQEVAPGFTVERAGKRGIALVEKFRGRSWVMKTQPHGLSGSCVLTSVVNVPVGLKTSLILEVSHHLEADPGWNLVVNVNGTTVLKTLIGPGTTKDGWITKTVDLSGYAGKRIHLEIHNQEITKLAGFGYWRSVRIISQ